MLIVCPLGRWTAGTAHQASRNLGTGLRSGLIYDVYKAATRRADGDVCEDNSPRAEVLRGNPTGSAEMWRDWAAEVRAAADSLDTTRRNGQAKL